MSLPPAAAVLDRVYLEVRAKLLEIAACLDRLDRAEGSELLSDHPRLRELRSGIATLDDGASHRAERIQMLFSDPYDADWNRPKAGAAD